MGKLKVSKRDITIFILGIFTMLVIDIIFDWESSKKSFIDGWNSVKQEETK